MADNLVTNQVAAAWLKMYGLTHNQFQVRIYGNEWESLLYWFCEGLINNFEVMAGSVLSVNPMTAA